MNPMSHTKQVISEIKKDSDSAIILFSGGKDSIVLLDICAKEFKRIVPIYMYFVPGMGHIEKKMRQFEKIYNIEVLHLPHWAVSHYHANSYMQVGLNDNAAKMPKLRVKDIENLARKKTGIEWVFDGIRVADSMARRMRLKTYRLNAICDESKRAHPLSQWSKADILAYIKKNRLPAPLDYGGKMVSGVDITKDSLQTIKDKWPEDYRKIINAFPLADSILVDFDEQ